MMQDLYPNHRVLRALNRFKNRHPENYDIAERFAMDLLAQGISELRITGYLTYLSIILDVVGKRLDDFTRDDVSKVLAHFQLRANRGEISNNTIFEVRKTLKKFFKWLDKEELVNWFTTGKCQSNLSPQDLITREEFEKMLDVCLNSRDRALLSLLYETGARIGEVASMRIKDISFDDYGAVVWLPRSKTQRRKLRVVYSARYLAEWISNHPLKNDREPHLWVKLGHKNYLKPMQYSDIRMQLKKIADRAGIKKRIYLHLFRHTRATKLLQQVSEVVGAKYMGWTLGTRMIKTHIHLADQDVEKAILETYGIKPTEKKELEVVQCSRCTFINPRNAKFCSRCGLPLTEEAVREVEEWEEKKAKLMELLANPEVLTLVMELRDEIEKLKRLVEANRGGRQWIFLMPRKKEHILDHLDLVSFRILQELREGFKTFSELDEIVPISTPNFDKRLQELLNLGLIKETLITTEKGRGKKVYVITPTGKRILELLEEIERVYKEGVSLEEKELKWAEDELKKY